MKLLLITLCLYSAQSFSKTCSVYELKGKVVLEKTGLFLVVAEKTLSEKKLPVYLTLQDKFAPYVDHYISGTFVLPKKTFMSGDQIFGVRNIQDAVSDPLNQNQDTVEKKLKDETCPKL